MADNEDKKLDIEDLGGGVQRKTSRFLQRDNELYDAENASFDEPGGIGKKTGYLARNASPLTSTTTTSTSTSTTTTSTSTSSSTSTSTSTTTTA